MNVTSLQHAVVAVIFVFITVAKELPVSVPSAVSVKQNIAYNSTASKPLISSGTDTMDDSCNGMVVCAPRKK